MLALRPLLYCAVLVACGTDTAPADDAAPSGPASSSGATAPGATDPGSAPGEQPIPLPPSGQYMGATPVKDGVDFRVWAPNASSVAVTGEVGRHDMAKENGGTFFVHVDGAHAGQHYTYAITTDDAELSRLDPRGRQIDQGQSVVVDPRTYAWKTNTFTPPAREKAVVYEMHVGTFAGSFAGATAKLDALADLGVNVVELMPVQSFGGRNGWGYNPQSYYAPHAPYGSPDNLRAFVDAAHTRGIAVVMDVVYNHYDGWAEAPLRCFDGHCPTGTYGIYFFEDDAYKKTPWGPRPAYATKEVADFIVDNVFSWMTEYHVDGFRQDSVSNIRAIDGKGTVPGGVELLERANDVAKKTLPGALLVAEDLKGYAALTKPLAAGGFGFDSQWDGFFQWAITSAVVATDDTSRDIGKVSEALSATYDGDPFARLLYVETHDTAGNAGARLPVRIDADDPTSLAARKRTMLASGVLLTAPGVPMIFMGQELLSAQQFASPPPALDWTKTDSGVLAFHRDMIKARRELSALAGKNVSVTHLNASATDRVIGYRRWNVAGDDVMVVANFGSRQYTQYDIGLPSAGAWIARVDGDDVRYGSDFGAASATTVSVKAAARDGLPYTGAITLGSYSVVLLTR